MATQTVTEQQNPGFDINEARDCIAKARGIIEMIGPYAINTFGYDTAETLCNSAFAVSEQLERLAEMTGSRPHPKVES